MKVLALRYFHRSSYDNVALLGSSVRKHTDVATSSVQHLRPQVTALGDHKVSQSGFVSLFSVANCISRLLAGSASMLKFDRSHDHGALSSRCLPTRPPQAIARSSLIEAIPTQPICLLPCRIQHADSYTSCRRSFIPDRLMKVYAVPRTASIIFLCALSAGAAVLNGFADVQLLNLSSFLSGFAFGGMQAS